MSVRFPKSERLTRRGLFSQIITTGDSVKAYPIKFVFLEVDATPSDAKYQIAFAVSKRRFKKAVDRNRMKRVMRESWRIHKDEFIRIFGEKKYVILAIYMSDEKVDRNQLDRCMQKAIAKWPQEG